jgi:hypothetical protein
VQAAPALDLTRVLHHKVPAALARYQDRRRRRVRPALHQVEEDRATIGANERLASRQIFYAANDAYVPLRVMDGLGLNDDAVQDIPKSITGWRADVPVEPDLGPESSADIQRLLGTSIGCGIFDDFRCLAQGMDRGLVQRAPADTPLGESHRQAQVGLKCGTGIDEGGKGAQGQRGPKCKRHGHSLRMCSH